MKYLHERHIRDGETRRPKFAKVLTGALLLHLASRRVRAQERAGGASPDDADPAATSQSPEFNEERKPLPKSPGALVLVTGVAVIVMVALAVRKRPSLALLLRETLILSALRIHAHRVAGK